MRARYDVDNSQMYDMRQIIPVLQENLKNILNTILVIVQGH